MNEIAIHPSVDQTTDIPQSESFTAVKKEWHTVESGPNYMISNEREGGKVDPNSDKNCCMPRLYLVREGDL